MVWDSTFLYQISPRCSVSRMPGWFCPCLRPSPSQVTCQGSRPMVMFPHMDICSNVSLKRWTNMERILTAHHLISCKCWLTHDYFLGLWWLELELLTMLPRCDDHGASVQTWPGPGATPDTGAAQHTTIYPLGFTSPSLLAILKISNRFDA